MGSGGAGPQCALCERVPTARRCSTVVRAQRCRTTHAMNALRFAGSTSRQRAACPRPRTTARWASRLGDAGRLTGWTAGPASSAAASERLGPRACPLQAALLCDAAGHAPDPGALLALSSEGSFTAATVAWRAPACADAGRLGKQESGWSLREGSRRLDPVLHDPASRAIGGARGLVVQDTTCPTAWAS